MSTIEFGLQGVLVLFIRQSASDVLHQVPMQKNQLDRTGKIAAPEK